MSHGIPTSIVEIEQELHASRGTARRQELLKKLWQLKLLQEGSQESDA